MDIKQFISTVTPENAQELSKQYVDYERNRESQKGQKYSIPAFLRNMSRARNEVRRAGLDKNLEDKLLREYLKASDKDWEYKESLFTGNLENKQLNCLFFNPHKVIEIAEQYINHTSVKYQLAGLLAVTGRRPIELLYSGLFFDGNTRIKTAIKHTENHLISLGYENPVICSPTEILGNMVKFHNIEIKNPSLRIIRSDLSNGLYILFSGQAKQRKDKENRGQPFAIPTLIESSLIIESIKSLRQKITMPEGLNPWEISDYFHNRYSKEVGQTIKKIYNEVLPKPALSPSELRGIYGVACYYFNHGPDSNVSQSIYLAHILGHNPKNLKSVFSYDNYKVSE